MKPASLLTINKHFIMSMNPTNEFANDVLEGLTSKPKFLQSKYFYDDQGSKLFQQIMRMPEYYLTDCELEIITSKKKEIIDVVSNGQKIELIELGAGDGLKTTELIAQLTSQKVDFSYIPIDISATAINELEKMLLEKFPNLHFNGKTGDYFYMLDQLKKGQTTQKLILFLGSNIGNMTLEQSIRFLQKLGHALQTNDYLLIGFDLKKDENIILNAYNDSAGITAAFNMNLLQRINDALDADFNLSNFKHIETYNNGTGTASSLLVSLCKQKVQLRKLNLSIEFETDEPIHTEISQKYDWQTIEQMADQSGFQIVRNLTDKRQYFTDSIWKLK